MSVIYTVAERIPYSLCLLIFFFFFQAEDGIRDRTVTGVQTCALPISKRRRRFNRQPPESPSPFRLCQHLESRQRLVAPWQEAGCTRFSRCRHAISRSEERRVGKECRSRWSPYQ